METRVINLVLWIVMNYFNSKHSGLIKFARMQISTLKNFLDLFRFPDCFTATSD